MDDGQIQVLCILAVMMGTILAAFWKRTGHGMFTSDVRRELKRKDNGCEGENIMRPW